MQNIPLFKSTQECEHSVDHKMGRLSSAICREKHVLRPFSREDSGPTTLNTQKLTYMKDTPTAANAGQWVYYKEHDIWGGGGGKLIIKSKKKNRYP